MDVEPTITIKVSLLQNLVRRDYIDDARWIISEGCALGGHRAKIDKAYEMKADWQRGCVCGRNPYA